MHQQSSGTNDYPKNIIIYIIYGIGGKISTSVLVHTDSRITFQLLQNQKTHTRLIGQIRTKVTEWNSTNGGWNSVE